MRVSPRSDRRRSRLTLVLLAGDLLTAAGIAVYSLVAGAPLPTPPDLTSRTHLDDPDGHTPGPPSRPPPTEGGHDVRRTH
ncbi:hypothetical protein ACR9E3_13340 [Actinomycetospora sp. C-140]